MGCVNEGPGTSPAAAGGREVCASLSTSSSGSGPGAPRGLGPQAWCRDTWERLAVIQKMLRSPRELLCLQIRGPSERRFAAPWCPFLSIKKGEQTLLQPLPSLGRPREKRPLTVSAMKSGLGQREGLLVTHAKSSEQEHPSAVTEGHKPEQQSHRCIPPGCSKKSNSPPERSQRDP